MVNLKSILLLIFKAKSSYIFVLALCYKTELLHQTQKKNLSYICWFELQAWDFWLWKIVNIMSLIKLLKFVTSVTMSMVLN